MSLDENSIPKLENHEDRQLSLLDLPDVEMDCILERLSPLDLCRVAQVCTCLRDRSSTDYIWEKHIQQKWSSLVGDAVLQEWQWHQTEITNARNFLQLHLSGTSDCSKDVNYFLEDNCIRGPCEIFHGVWPFPGILSYLEVYQPMINLIKNCSKKALFLCLETGRFWFPAQLYMDPKLMISCYDVIVSYDSRTDTFKAREPIGLWGQLMGLLIDPNIQWNRVRLSPPETFLRGYYKSTCLSDLKPGEYIEIQTRRNVTCPYNLTLAVVDHMESCDKDVNKCRCQYSDTLVVEFKLLPDIYPLSRLVLNRNIPKEQCIANCLFGGVRKLNDEEIEKWNSNLNSLMDTNLNSNLFAEVWSEV